MGGNVTTHASDISTPAGARSLIAHCEQTLGGVDILVHSAGVWPVEEVPVSELTDERWAHTMKQNVDAMFYVSRSAAKVMGNGGRIVLIASTAVSVVKRCTPTTARRRAR